MSLNSNESQLFSERIEEDEINSVPTQVCVGKANWLSKRKVTVNSQSGAWTNNHQVGSKLVNYLTKKIL